jgi:hypothetical protein
MAKPISGQVLITLNIDSRSQVAFNAVVDALTQQAEQVATSVDGGSTVTYAGVVTSKFTDIIKEQPVSNGSAPEQVASDVEEAPRQKRKYTRRTPAQKAKAVKKTAKRAPAKKATKTTAKRKYTKRTA